MKLTLTRRELREDGIFSELTDDKNEIIAHTLEHSYDCKPKIYDGEFTCKRGMHQLAHMTKPFETFEITGVEGHSNILFHSGNWNDDSEGCVLLGLGIAQSDKGQMITQSRQAFDEFMKTVEGLDELTLVVRS